MLLAEFTVELTEKPAGRCVRAACASEAAISRVGVATITDTNEGASESSIRSLPGNFRTQRTWTTSARRSAPSSAALQHRSSGSARGSEPVPPSPRFGRLLGRSSARRESRRQDRAIQPGYRDARESTSSAPSHYPTVDLVSSCTRGRGQRRPQSVRGVRPPEWRRSVCSSPCPSTRADS